MGRLLLALLVGAVGALIVHIGVVFLMPRLAEDNAWARLTATTEPFRPAVISAETAATPGALGSTRRFGFLDPAFVTAACRFTTADGPVRLAAETTGEFWSAAIHSRSGDTLYSINQRLAPEERLDLTVGTAEQFEAATLAGTAAGEDSIPVEVADGEFYLTLRGLVAQESKRFLVDRFVGSLTCRSLGEAPMAVGDSAPAS